MYNLLYMITIGTAPLITYLGDYNDLASCQSAIREVYATKMNAPGQRNPEFDKIIQIQIDNKKEFLCVPIKKVDK